MESPTTPDGEYLFTIELVGVDELTRPLEDALYEAGCDDATLSLRGGRAFLAFARAADSFEEAVQSAMTDVTSAGIGTQVVLVDPILAGGPRI